MTLNAAQIKTLAEFAGFKISGDLDGDEKETEITVSKCPEKGVQDEDGSILHPSHIAYLTEYPEEGVCPL